ASTYPFIASVPVLIGIGLVEGALTAAGVPSLNAEVSRRAPRGAQGRTQGMYQLAWTLAQVAGSIAGGALYGLRPAYAFFCASGVCLAGAGGGLVLAGVQRGRSSVARVSS